MWIILGRPSTEEMRRLSVHFRKIPFLRSREDTRNIHVPVLNCVLYQFKFTQVNIVTMQCELANSDTKREMHLMCVCYRLSHTGHRIKLLMNCSVFVPITEIFFTSFLFSQAYANTVLIFTDDQFLMFTFIQYKVPSVFFQRRAFPFEKES